MALDMYQERKWKKGINYVISNQLSNKVKKSSRKKKMNELYKRCMCLYLSMNINNNLTDISMGNENKNMTERLNTYIKSVSNIDYLNNQFSHWKKVLKEIKTKIGKKMGEQNMSKTKSLSQVIELMESMVIIQEKTIQKIKEINNVAIKNNDEGRNNSEQITIATLAMDVEEGKYCNEKLKLEANNHLYTEYFEKNFHNLDINIMSKELNEVIEEIVNEINSDEVEIMLNSNECESLLSVNYSNNSSSASDDFNTKKFVLSVNPKQLFYDNHNISKNPAELKSYLEKFVKVENEKIEILPNYNFKLIAGAEIDVNKSSETFYNLFNKIFPPIYFTDNNDYDVKMIESEIDLYKTKYDRVLKDPEQLKLYKLKFDNFTTIQKLILIWSLLYYGTNTNILSEVLNIFEFSKSIPFERDETFIYLDTLLQKMNIDLLASNFETRMTKFDFRTESSHYIYNLDSPMLNSSNCNFYYNNTLYNFVNYKKSNLNYSEIIFHYPSSNKSKISIQDFRLHLINFNPIFKNINIRKDMLSYLKEDIKKICNRLDNLYQINQINLSNYSNNLFLKISKENQKIPIRKLSGTTIGTSRMDVLNQLLNTKVDFNSSKSSIKALDNTKPNIRQDTLEGVSFFSQTSINKEWEILRTPWYQNNPQFKPKFRKPYKQINQTTVNALQPNFNNASSQAMNIFKNLNDNKCGY